MLYPLDFYNFKTIVLDSETFLFDSDFLNKCLPNLQRSFPRQDVINVGIDPRVAGPDNQDAVHHLFKHIKQMEVDRQSNILQDYLESLWSESYITTPGFHHRLRYIGIGAEPLDLRILRALGKILDCTFYGSSHPISEAVSNYFVRHSNEIMNAGSHIWIHYINAIEGIQEFNPDKVLPWVVQRPEIVERDFQQCRCAMDILSHENLRWLRKALDQKFGRKTSSRDLQRYIPPTGSQRPDNDLYTCTPDLDEYFRDLTIAAPRSRDPKPSRLKGYRSGAQMLPHEISQIYFHEPDRIRVTPAVGWEDESTRRAVQAQYEAALANKAKSRPPPRYLPERKVPLQLAAGPSYDEVLKDRQRDRVKPKGWGGWGFPYTA